MSGRSGHIQLLKAATLYCGIVDAFSCRRIIGTNHGTTLEVFAWTQFKKSMPIVHLDKTVAHSITTKITCE